MTPPPGPPRLPEIPRDMVRFGDYGEIVLPPVGESGAFPVVSGGIDAFGGGASGLAALGDAAAARGNPVLGPSPLAHSVPPADGMDVTRHDLSGMTYGIMQLVGMGMEPSPTVTMSRVQLDTLLNQMGPREVVVDPDATNPADMSPLPDELPLAARAGSVRVYSGTAVVATPEAINDAVTAAENLMHETGLTMPSGVSGPPLPAASWFTTLRVAGRDALNTPASLRNDFSQMTVDALIYTDPRTPGNILNLSASIRDTLDQLRSDTLSGPQRQSLESRLSEDVATLRDRTALVTRWRTYFNERSSVEHTMDRTLSSFAAPFGQDFVRLNVETRVARGRNPGESWEDAFVRVTGSEMFPASPFPSRVTGVADFVSPPDGSDLADPWAAHQHGIRLEVDGDPAAFARFIVDTVNRGGENVMVGPVYSTEIIEGIQHEPHGFRFVELEATVEDVAPGVARRSWETASVRIDPGNPNRVLVTQTVPVIDANGRPAMENGAPVTREVSFFVEVSGR